MKLEINRPKSFDTWYGGYRVEFVQQAIQPLVTLEERLREYIGYPNNEATRTMIQSEWFGWNEYDNVVYTDINKCRNVCFNA